MLLFGYEQRSHKDSKLVDLLNDLAKIDLDLVKERDTNRRIALEANEKIREYNKIYYDKRHRTRTKYNPGDYVLIRDTLTKPGEDKKLKPVYKGPY